MKKLTFLSFFALFFTTTVFSQGKQVELPIATPGTYQITIAQSKYVVVIAQETLTKIEELRDDTIDKTEALSELITVFIPSRKTVNSPSFKPLVEFIYE
ncbi:MAG: hypothetical protein H0V01_11795 [Bacteroidetes bacterium]|nr:hypothetical protein [Bacteroidota bacterium]HET6245741.1 hypothetical protein [Bacteroidia bacterium]